MPMQLYSRWQNSAGERVRIALNLKAVPYDYVRVGSSDWDEYTRFNPQGLLPALRIDNVVIAQSTAILEYLEETYPQRPLLPRDPLLRAQARAFAQLIVSDLHPLNNNRVRKYLGEKLGIEPDGIAMWYGNWIAVALKSLEAILAARQCFSPFCFGDEPGWAELHLVPQMANARRFNCDLRDYPLLCAIDAKCRALEAFACARPEQQKDFPGHSS